MYNFNNMEKRYGTARQSILQTHLNTFSFIIKRRFKLQKKKLQTATIIITLTKNMA